MASKDFDKYLQFGEQRVRDGLLPHAQKGLDDPDHQAEAQEQEQEGANNDLTDKYPPRAKTGTQSGTKDLSR